MTIDLLIKSFLHLPEKVTVATPVLLPGGSQGRGGMVGCRLWGRRESDTTERLHFHALEKEMATHSSAVPADRRARDEDARLRPGRPLPQLRGAAR